MDLNSGLFSSNPALYDPNSGSIYYRYQLAAAVPCDADFRKFLACGLPLVHVLPSKTGPTLKLTQRGFVQVPADYEYPLERGGSYHGLALWFEPVDAHTFELHKKEGLTKVYFTGFPLGASVQDVELTFNRFGEVQFVFLMKPKAKPSGAFVHGYFFFGNRNEVERLLAFPGRLFFDRYRIRYEEFKSTIPGKRQKVKRAVALNKKLQISSIHDMEKEQSQNRKSKIAEADTLPNLASNLDFRCLFGQQRPYLNNCGKVAQNVASNCNIRFNILTGHRPRAQPQAGNPASLLAGLNNLAPL